MKSSREDKSDPMQMSFGQSEQVQTLLETWWSFGQVMRQRIIPTVIGQLALNLDIKEFLLLKAMTTGIIYPKQICDHLATNPSDVSRMLEHLEQLGLLSRSLDPKDSRRIRVVLTEHGTQTIEQMRHEVEMYLTKAFVSLSANELEHFSQTMKTVIHNLKAQFQE